MISLVLAATLIALSAGQAQAQDGGPLLKEALPGWSIQPSPVEKRQAEADAFHAQSDRCRSLMASDDPALRQQALVLCSGDPAAALLPDRPTPIPKRESPAAIISCDPIGCWDHQGNRYTGSGAIMIRSDGKPCRQVGGVILCD